MYLLGLVLLMIHDLCHPPSAIIMIDSHVGVLTRAGSSVNMTCATPLPLIIMTDYHVGAFTKTREAEDTRLVPGPFH